VLRCGADGGASGLLQRCSAFLAGSPGAGSLADILSRRAKFLSVAATLALALVVASMADARGFRRYLRLRQDVATIEARNRSLAEQNEALKGEVAALQRDARALERAAREELGFVKPNEVIFNLE
jgi:cell division protein FtsB